MPLRLVAAGSPPAAAARRRDGRQAVAITLLGVVVLMANNGLIIAGLSAFDGTVVGYLHIGVAALKLRDTVTIVTLGFAVPVVGYLLDRIAAKTIIVAGLVLMALGLAGYRFVHSATDIYALHILLGLSQACCGLVSHIVLISRWTERRRGLGIGAVVAGSSIGNGVAPGLNVWLAGMIGWRDAISAGAVVAILLIPLILFLYRERPAGIVRSEIERPREPSEGALRRVLAAPAFWTLSVTAAATAFCILGLATSLMLFVERDLHQPVYRATNLLLTLFLSATGAQFVTGVAADRLGAAGIHVWLVAALFAGALLFDVKGASVWGSTIAVVLFGAGWGGSASLLQIRPVDLFSGPALGRALAGVAVIETFGAATAPPLMGRLYELTGQYRLGFSILAALAFLALVCVSLLRHTRLDSGGGIPRFKDKSSIM